DGGDGVPARIAIRAGVDSEQRCQLHLERSLFAGFANRRQFNRLADIDEAARNRPSGRKILALDEDNAPFHLDDHVGGDRRAFRTRHDSAMYHPGVRTARQPRKVINIDNTATAHQSRPMRVARLYDFDDIRIEEAARPEVGPGDVLVRASACGICSGDVMPWY